MSLCHYVDMVVDGSVRAFNATYIASHPTMSDRAVVLWRDRTVARSRYGGSGGI